MLAVGVLHGADPLLARREREHLETVNPKLPIQHVTGVRVAVGEHLAQIGALVGIRAHSRHRAAINLKAEIAAPPLLRAVEPIETVWDDPGGHFPIGTGQARRSV